MKSQSIPMSIDEFHTMPWKLGWKYEYYGNAARISPSHGAIATVTLAVTPRLVTPPCPVRRVTEADIPLLLPAYCAAFANTIDYCDYTDEQIAKAAAENLASFFAGKRGAPLAVSQIALDPDQATPTAIGVANVVEKRNGDALLDLLFVAPAWQGKGVATALVGTVLNELHALQKPTLKSRYMLGNVASRAWHQRVGFVEEVDLFLIRHYYYHAFHKWERHAALGDLDAERLAKLAERRDQWGQLLEEVEEHANTYGITAVMPGGK
jgi:RimJ/RimL family protein N-acetyltransferase